MKIGLAVFLAGCGGVASSKGGQNATLSLSGTLTASVPVDFYLVVDPSTKAWDGASQAGQFSAAGGFSWGGLVFQLPSTPAIGSYDQASSPEANGQVAQANGGPVWLAATDPSGSVGSSTLTLTSIGEMTQTGYYAAPHGSWSAVMSDSSRSAPDLTAELTF